MVIKDGFYENKPARLVEIRAGDSRLLGYMPNATFLPQELGYGRFWLSKVTGELWKVLGKDESRGRD